MPPVRVIEPPLKVVLVFRLSVPPPAPKLMWPVALMMAVPVSPY